jgi:hypothetical protein
MFHARIELHATIVVIPMLVLSTVTLAREETFTQGLKPDLSFEEASNFTLQTPQTFAITERPHSKMSSYYMDKTLLHFVKYFLCVWWLC